MGEIILHPARHRPPDVRGHRAVAVVAAGWPDARQHRDLRVVCRHLGIEHRDRGDDLHAGVARGRQARLQRTDLSRQPGGGGHARHLDPAVDQHDCLRGPDRHFRPAALPRRHHTGHHPVVALHARHHRVVPFSPQMGRPACGNELANEAQTIARSGAADSLVRHRCRLHLRGCSDTDRRRRPSA